MIPAGFASDGGTPKTNQLTAQQQVEAVRAALATKSLVPGRAATDLPIAGRTTLDSRECNRRVKAYLVPEAR